ncbi:glycine hydroxymethyltransferase [Nematocida displodere]|uniref:Serine hydroxymethyltransferase n=1 Tax=Nematocida displodere TaxID=1805483 RepID=A0A177EBA5_9MICR|nr:glycine hydroxymethyltransferase [Nematocida displodere]
MTTYQDIELEHLIKEEEQRQDNTLTMIASENYVFPYVYACSGSMLTNKYSEGRVGARYYGGTAYIDLIEDLCQKRALKLFNLDPEVWGASVQPYSGSVANFAAYSAMTVPGGKIMGMDLPSGGHLTHGFQTKAKKISGTSLYFSSHPYTVTDKGVIDYDALEEQFNQVLPDILICGYSAHSQDLQYERLRSIAGNRAFLFADISHISALISAGLMNSPFEHCDVVMTTTHKGLRGPRGAIIFFKKSVTVSGTTHNLDQKVNSAVFPLLQGGPHNHTIAGIAHALEMASRPEFKASLQQVVKNSQVLVRVLKNKGYNIVTESTVNHIALVDLRNKNIKGQDVETVCDFLGLTINKNAVPNDQSFFKPSGIRLGTYAITTRGLKEEETERLALIIDFAACMALAHQESGSSLALSEWLCEKSPERQKMLLDVQNQIAALARQFPVPKLHN